MPSLMALQCRAGAFWFRPLRCQAVYDKYGGPKEANWFDGDHNSLRPSAFLNAGAKFLCEAMAVPAALAAPSPPPRRGRLPWLSGTGARIPFHLMANPAADVELEAALRDSVQDSQRGRGANNTIQQQLEQQRQQQQAAGAPCLPPCAIVPLVSLNAGAQGHWSRSDREPYQTLLGDSKLSHRGRRWVAEPVEHGRNVSLLPGGHSQGMGLGPNRGPSDSD